MKASEILREALLSREGTMRFVVAWRNARYGASLSLAFLLVGMTDVHADSSIKETRTYQLCPKNLRSLITSLACTQPVISTQVGYSLWHQQQAV